MGNVANEPFYVVRLLAQGCLIASRELGRIANFCHKIWVVIIVHFNCLHNKKKKKIPVPSASPIQNGACQMLLSGDQCSNRRFGRLRKLNVFKYPVEATTSGEKGAEQRSAKKRAQPGGENGKQSNGD